MFLRLVYEFFMGGTTSDTVPLFGKFKKKWDEMDQSKFSSGIDDQEVSAALNPQFRDEMKKFIENKMKNKIFRYFLVSLLLSLFRFQT